MAPESIGIICLMVKRLVLTLLLSLGLALPAESGGAVPYEGPQLAYNFQKVHLPRKLDSLSDFGRLKIRATLVTSGPLGDFEQNLLRTTFFKGRYLVQEGPAWSPDGLLLALTLEMETRDGEASDAYIISRDGTGLQRLTRFGDATRPVFSADGQSVYFQRGERDVWAIGTNGRGARRIASLPGSNVPTSVSPNGDVALSRRVCKLGDFFAVVERCRFTVHALSPATASPRLLVRRARDAAFSPDGSRIVYVSQRNTVLPFQKDDRESISDLFVLDLATGLRTRLTRTKRAREEAPSWDPSGERIVFVRNRGRSSRLVEINADGSCEMTLPKKPLRPRVIASFTGPTWQPGPARGAGRIVC